MLLGSKILLQMIVKAFPSMILTFSVDDTIERRRGKKIRAKGIFKDPLGTGSGKHVTCSGLRWTPVMLLVRVPFMKRTVALPFLTILSHSERTSAKLNRRHKSPQRSAEQICYLLRRWFPKHTLVFVADAGYATTGLFRSCRKLQINLVTRAKSNLRFFRLAPPRTGKKGRPCTKGERLPSLKELRNSEARNWTEVVVESYGGSQTTRFIATFDCLWAPVEGERSEVRLLFVRKPHDGSDTPVFCLITQARDLSPEQIVGTYTMRWSQEVTHREAREHLGVETQRQWSDLAIERSTPLLFGIYSLVFLLGHQLHERGDISLPQTSWYKKEEPAFSDLLNAVRVMVREHQLLQVWSRHPILRNIQCPNELFSILEGFGMAA